MEEASQESRPVELEVLNIEWQNKNPNKKFKDHKCGRTLKSFLIKECELEELTTDEFEIVPATIKAKLEGMSNLPTQESDLNGKGATATKELKAKKQPDTRESESD